MKVESINQNTRVIRFCSILFLLIFTVSGHLFAQEKFEKERRIKRDEVPVKALRFIDSLRVHAKIKWYEEEGLTGKTIEAKFKQNRTKYSIEFDPLGTLEDLEIEVNWARLDVSLKNAITNQLNQQCSKHKIVKVQEQFTGEEHHLFTLLSSGIKSEELKVNYEIVVSCHDDQGVHLFEYVFNEEGIILTKHKIIFKNSSHLEY